MGYDTRIAHERRKEDTMIARGKKSFFIPALVALAVTLAAAAWSASGAQAKPSYYRCRVIAADNPARQVIDSAAQIIFSNPVGQ